MKRLSHHVTVETDEENYNDLLKQMTAWGVECVQGYYAFEVIYGFEKQTSGYSHKTNRKAMGIKGFFDRADDAAMFKLAWYKS